MRLDKKTQRVQKRGDQIRDAGAKGNAKYESPTRTSIPKFGAMSLVLPMFAVLTLVGCGAPNEGPAGHLPAMVDGTASASQGQSNSSAPTVLPARCPKVEKKLLDLMDASDRAGFAKREGIDYQAGFVRVILELSKKDDAPPQQQDVRVEGREGKLVQAMAAVDKLCSLAADPRIVSIRTPAKPVPLER